jgi:hypothetical protein
MLIIRLAAKPPSRRGPLSSNVRPPTSPLPVMQERNAPLTFVIIAAFLAVLSLALYVASNAFIPSREQLATINGHVGYMRYYPSGKYVAQKMVLFVRSEERLHQLVQVDFSCCVKGLQTLQPNDPVSVLVEWDSLNHETGTYWAIARSGQEVLSYDQSRRLLQAGAARMRPLVVVPLLLCVVFVIIGVYQRKKHGSWRVA